MKKALALALAMILLLSAFPALAEYDQHVNFTICSAHSNSTMDYTSDELYKFFAEKFNYDFEVYPVAKDAQDEKFRIWINGGTMPDSVTWRNFKYQEYVNYAEQGLIASLPEGWEEKYPNLFWMVQKTGIYEKMKVDGLTYGIPHATFARFGNMETVVNHLSIYYRKDWAEKLGMEIGDKITLDELAQYIRGCMDNDFAGNGNTLGLSASPDNIANLWMLFANVKYDAFAKGEEGYLWSFTDPSVLEALKLANDWYQKGLLDPDFYLQQSADSINNFTSGLSSCLFYNCAISSYATNKATFEQSTGLNSGECMGITTIATNEGQARAIETNNWWSVTMFNPGIDAEVMDRLLAMMDYTCTEEGQLAVLLGVPEVNWTKGENGETVILTPKKEDGTYPATVDLFNSYNIYRTEGILADDYSFINPANDPEVIAEVNAMYAVRQTGNIIPLDYDYEFFSSDSKANFSLKMEDDVARLIITDPAQLESEYNSYIEQNKGIWEPVVEDLNAVYFAK